MRGYSLGPHHYYLCTQYPSDRASSFVEESNPPRFLITLRAKPKLLQGRANTRLAPPVPGSSHSHPYNPWEALCSRPCPSARGGFCTGCSLCLEHSPPGLSSNTCLRATLLIWEMTYLVSFSCTVL